MEEYYSRQEDMNDLITYASKADEGTMYLCQAIQQPDKAQLSKAIIQEVNGHFEKKYWIIVPKEDVPEVNPVLNSVLVMKYSRYIKT